jgi:chromate reductase
MRVLGISGSLRAGSYNTALLRAAAAELPARIEFREWRGLEAVPPYDEDADAPARAPIVARLRRDLARADAVMIATPEYNHSIPGALKNALDWASRPFPNNCLRGKPVAVVGASTGLFGAVWAQADLRKVLKAIGASVLEVELPVPAAHDAFTADGRLREPRLAATLAGIVDGLLALTAKRAA